MNGFFAALTFLTIIPLPNKMLQNCSFDKCQNFFPAVGLLLGIIVSIASLLFINIFPLSISSALSVILLLILTGGLHFDGLSDTADGFLSRRPREEVKTIMKDSRLGSFGSLAQICVIVLKITALSALGGKASLALLFIPILGRSSILFLSHITPPASESGLGYTLNSSSNKTALTLGILLSLLFAVLFFDITGLLSILFALAALYILSKISIKKIGGYTGDVLGAGCEISEMTALIILSISG